MDNLLTWDEFGELRVPSRFEQTTSASIKDAPFLTQPIHSTSYFMFMVARWRVNVVHRHLQTGGFCHVINLNNILFKWLLRHETEAVTCLAETEDTILPWHTVGTSIVRVLHSDIGSRLQRVFRLIVYKTNLIAAASATTFSTRHLQDMIHKRKNITSENMAELNSIQLNPHIHKRFIRKLNKLEIQ